MVVARAAIVLSEVRLQLVEVDRLARLLGDEQLDAVCPREGMSVLSSLEHQEERTHEVVKHEVVTEKLRLSVQRAGHRRKPGVLLEHGGQHANHCAGTEGDIDLALFPRELARNARRGKRVLLESD